MHAGVDQIPHNGSYFNEKVSVMLVYNNRWQKLSLNELFCIIVKTSFE